MFELLIIAVVLLLVFGAGKLRGAGSDLGAAVKGLRKAVQARPTENRSATPDSSANAAGTLPDAEFPEIVASRARGSGKPGA